uniref:Uncharacterized protein n=1 Tax=Aegilops tauschii subsp. strangulata TaxID=200361 RepID=A0A453K367_AEGTS
MHQTGTVRAKSNPLVFRGLNFSDADSSSSRNSSRKDGSKGGAHQQTKSTEEVCEKGNPAVAQYLAGKFQNLSGTNKATETKEMPPEEQYNTPEATGG